MAIYLGVKVFYYVFHLTLEHKFRPLWLFQLKMKVITLQF